MSTKSTMRIPGFTGEASLYKTDGHYRTAGASVQTGTGTVIPQHGIGSSCYYESGYVCCWFPPDGWVCRPIMQT